MRGQASFELLIIISFIIIVMTAYLAAFGKEFFPVSAMANVKIAAIGAASSSVRGSCLFYGLSNIALENDTDIRLYFRALSTGTPCISVSKSAIIERLGNYSVPYNIRVSHGLAAPSTTTATVSAGPDFAMSAPSALASVSPGDSASYTLSLTPSGGFSSSVSLSASGLPTGATASFSPSSLASSGSSTVTISTSSTTPPGTYTITLSGIGGGKTHAATVTLTVSGTPDFTIAASPPSSSVVQGASVSYVISLTPTSGFSSSVSLSASGLPAGATATFSPSSVAPSATSTLSVQTSATTPAGTYVITVSGTGGGLTRTRTVSLTVSTATDFAMSASPASLGVVQGGSNTTVVSLTPISGFSSPVSLSASGLPAGATYSFSPASVTPSGTSTLAIQASPTTPAGTYTITVSGTGGGITRSITINLVVSEVPDFSIGITQLASKAPAANPLRLLGAAPIASSVTPGGSVAYNITLDASGGFSSSVALSASGLPPGATSTFTPSALTPPGSSRVNISTLSTTPQGTYTITFTATGGGQTHNITVTLTVSTAPNFAMSATPTSASVTPGSAASYSLSLTSAGGFSSAVALSASGLPAGATVNFTPSSVTPPGSSTVTINTSAATPAGTYTVTLNGTGGGLTRTSSVALTVSAAPDFAIAATPITSNIAPGGSATYTISPTSFGGFSQAISLSASGMPSGATPLFSPASVTPPGTSALTINTQATTPPGTYTITINATNGSIVRTTTATFTVSSTAADFAITALPPSHIISALYDEVRYNVSITPQGGFSSPVTVGYFGAPGWAYSMLAYPYTFTPPGNTKLIVGAQFDPVAGVYPITINATGGGKAHSTTVNLSVPGLVASPAQQILIPGDFAMYTVSLVPRVGFTSSVALSASGLPAGATATFSPASASPSAPSVLTIQTSSSTPIGIYTITITGTGGVQTYIGKATLKVAATTVCTNVQVNGPTADKVDVVFIACNYPSNQMSLFEYDVNLHKDTLLDKHPFNESRSKFNFYLVNDSTLTCTTVNGLTNTDYVMAMSTAALCPNDQVIMIRYDYGRSNAGGGFAYTVRNNPLVTIHEFGHSFGDLWDEYLSIGADAPAGATSGSIANCDHDSACPKWSAIAGTGCYLGCAYNNWYRPSSDSMMNVGTYSNLPFNQPSVNALNAKLNNYN